MKQGMNNVEEEAQDKSQAVPSSAKPSMADRLLAMSANEEKVDRGKWLADQMEELKKSKGIDSDEEPTEEEIKMQLKLPAKNKVEMNKYKEPLKKWILVENSGVPSWKKESLLEEEREPGWEAPTPPTVDRSLLLCKGEFRKETPKLPKISEVVKDKENVLREDLADDDEVVLFNNFCIIRTTKAGILKSKKDRRNEEEEDEIEFRGRFGGGRAGRGREGRGGRGDGGRGRDRFEGNESRARGFMRNRSISSSPGRDAGGYRSHSNAGSRQERKDGYSSHGRRGEEDRRADERRESHSRREHDRSDYEEKRSGGRRESNAGNRDDGRDGHGGGGSSAPASYKEYKARKSGGGGR